MTSPAATYTSPFVLSVLLLVSIPVIFLPPKTLLAIPDANESEDLALFHRAILSSSATPMPSSVASYFFRRRPAPKVALPHSDN
ncbi:hypothetical protein E2562_017984 [Oryza meyeriana var. granulata]|uniref:Uncharacterized protein n=1 Tax=Oryza meyeriana var. granulata TaxID=110450 RepID=A0A6G1F973_9ORYZ|nr:hypothetical protein E2562_017984 [Oryza meyeriana var. granulata]